MHFAFGNHHCSKFAQLRLYQLEGWHRRWMAEELELI